MLSAGGGDGRLASRTTHSQPGDVIRQARGIRRHHFGRNGEPEKRVHLQRAQADTDGLSQLIGDVCQCVGERFDVCAEPRAAEELRVPHKLLDSDEARRRERPR